MRKMSKIVAGVLVVGILVFLIPASAGALTIENAEGVVSSDFLDDVILAGGNVTVSGSVDGDLVAAGGFVRVEGEVAQDVIAAGGIVTIGGKADDDVRVAGGNVTIDGEIGDDLIAAGGTVVVSKGVVIGGDLVMTGGTVILEGEVLGNVKMRGGNVVFNGQARGDVELFSEDVMVREEARIDGNLFYESFREADIDEGAVIAGEVTKNIVERGEHGTILERPSRYDFGKWVMIPWILILGAVVLKMMRRKSRAVVEMISKKPAASFGWGLLTLIVAPIVGAALVVTVVAFPLGAITLAVLAIGLLIGGVAVSVWVGRMILRMFKKKDEVSWGWSLVVGGIVLPVVVAIPYVGVLIGMIAMVFGFGAIVVTMREIRRRRKEGQEKASEVRGED